MNRTAASIAAPIIYLAARTAVLMPDWFFVAVISTAKKTLEIFAPNSFGITVTSDLLKIFRNKSSSRLARKLILQARPAQFIAAVKGALNP